MEVGGGKGGGDSPWEMDLTCPHGRCKTPRSPGTCLWHVRPPVSRSFVERLGRRTVADALHLGGGAPSPLKPRFLPCDAMRSTVLVIVILSVCLSVTLVHCVHMVQPTIMISSPYGSHIILVSGDIKFTPKFEEDHPERGR